MAEEKTESKSKKEEKVVIKTVVVGQLPNQPVTKARDEDGNEVDLITIEEALTLILEKVNKIEKSVA